MKIIPSTRGREQGSTLLAYLFVALAVIATITAIATYVVQNMNFSQRRQDMVNAYQFAQGGAAIACLDVQQAYTNSGGFLNNLTTNLYVKNNALSSSSELVYERTISSPFTNQTVSAQLRMTNSSAPTSAKIFATATVGKVTQTAQVNIEMSFGYGAAIISTHQGTSSSGVSKSNAQDGNVVVDGGSKGTTKIDGGIMSNGSVNTNSCVVDNIQEQLYGTGSEIPDYTNPGSPDQLFDFNRFIAVADATGQHYPNLNAFVADAKTKTLEGVIAVDLQFGAKVPSLDSKTLPSGINIRGTLVFNFIPNNKGQTWDPLDKIVNTATMNINAANLSGLIATDPATYTSGYPPTYTDPTKKPSYPDIETASGGLYKNFTDDDDLPALMYNNAILDIHGSVNICGAVYSSSFMEIENKQSAQIQYFRGALIGGGGIFVENGSGATSIVSYDEVALGNLATAQGRGKTVKTVYRK